MLTCRPCGFFAEGCRAEVSRNSAEYVPPVRRQRGEHRQHRGRHVVLSVRAHGGCLHAPPETHFCTLAVLTQCSAPLPCLDILPMR